MKIYYLKLREIQHCFHWLKMCLDLIKKLETESLTIFEWFQNNYLKASSRESQVMLTIDDKLKISVGESLICIKH